MIMRALNTLPGQDDSEKLVSNQKQIDELNTTVDSLKNELVEKTNRIEELCRLANDSRDDTERIKTEVRLPFFSFDSTFFYICLLSHYLLTLHRDVYCYAAVV